MKCKLRHWTMLSFVLLFSLSLLGCSTNELEILNAELKTLNSNSYKSHTIITLDMDATSTDYLNKMTNEELKILKGIKQVQIDLNNSIKRSDDDLKYASNSNVQFKLGGISTQFDMWQQFDFSEGKNNIVNMFKIPSILTTMFPFKFAGKEYIEINSSDFKDLENYKNTVSKNINSGFYNPDPLDIISNLNFSSNLNELTMKNLTKDTSDFIRSFAKDFDTTNLTVTKTELSSYNNQECTAYELKMNSKEANQFVKSFIIALAKNKELRVYINNRILPFLGEAISKEVIENLFKELDNNMTTFEQTLEVTFKNIENINFLGTDGIKLNYFINKDGYLIGSKGIIDIKFNKNTIENLFSSVPQDNKTVEDYNEEILFKLSFDSDFTNINTEVTTDMPNILPTEKVTLKDIIEFFKQKNILQEKEMLRQKLEFEKAELEYENSNAAKGLITVKLNGKNINGDDYNISNDAVIIDNRVLFPLTAVTHGMGIYHTWLPETSQIVCSRNNEELKFTIGSKEVIMNGTKTTIDVAPVIINGRTYIPLRSTCELFGAKVEWIGARKVIDIIYSPVNF